MIAPLNTGLDSCPAIKLNRHSRAEHFQPGAGVISAAKGVKKVVIESDRSEKLERETGFEPATSSLGSLHSTN